MEMSRRRRARELDPRSVPWPLPGEADVVAVDTTWGKLQRLHPVPGVRTVGELELQRLVDAGYPTEALAYYRGGMHDWVTLALPTEPR